MITGSTRSGRSTPLPDTIERHARPDVLVRMLADAIMIVTGLFLGLVLRFFLPTLSDDVPALDRVDLATAVFGSADLLARGAPVLLLLALCVFLGGGIYTRTRFYPAFAKIPRLIQATTLAYVLFWMVSIAAPSVVPIPAVAIVAAWVVTLVMLIAARFWSDVWTRVFTEQEHQSTVPPACGVRKTLVIGGAGYIGSVLCRQLLARGYQVRVLDALLYGDDAIHSLIDNTAFELIEGDSRDLSHLVQAVRGMDAVIHLGEIVGDPACALDEQVTLEINLAATRMVAEVARGFGVQRFVYASSCSVYGASEGIVDERSAVNPVSLYARAKLGAERILLAMHGKTFHPVIVRLATVFGASPRPRFDLVVNTLAAQATVDKTISIFGGNQWRPFVHVADVARALILCLEKPAGLVEGQIFNVGADSENHTIRGIGDLIQRVLPETQVDTVAAAEDQRDYRVSFAKIRQELGFLPTTPVSDGIREIVDAIRRGEIRAYRDPRHNNAQFLRTAYASHRVYAVHPSPLYQPDHELLAHMLLEQTSPRPGPNSPVAA